jgi:pyridoxal/pyridoxine/pyridoxamine kinase
MAMWAFAPRVPVLNALGHRVTQLPTVQLSNHAGWPHVSGGPVPVDTLAGMVEALDRNGWLSQADAILTGYLPSAAHVDFAAGLIDRLRAATPGLRITSSTRCWAMRRRDSTSRPRPPVPSATCSCRAPTW